jgi:hypothetical protein
MCDEDGERCVDCLVDADCDDSEACTNDSCDPNTGQCLNIPIDNDNDGFSICSNEDCDDTDEFINPDAEEVYDGIDNDCQNGPDDNCYFTANLIATGQWGEDAGVTFGLYETGSTTENPDNWSADDTVRLQLIDANDVTGDPNDYTYLTEDIRAATGQLEIAWYALVEIGGQADPNYYPELTWDPSELGCLEVNGTEYVYMLIRGLGDSGDVLVEDMGDSNSYQTSAADGDPIQYYTIMWVEKPEPEPVTPTKKPTRQIYPWPGVYPGGLIWGGLPFTSGFPGGLPYNTFGSAYPPGLSVPSFPGTYPGFTYPSSLYTKAWTPTVPRFPVTFPTLGIFSPVGSGWNRNYFIGYKIPSMYQSGWYYSYRNERRI